MLKNIVLFRLEAAGDPMYLASRTITLCGVMTRGLKISGGNFMTLRNLEGAKLSLVSHTSIRAIIQLPVRSSDHSPIIKFEQED